MSEEGICQGHEHTSHCRHGPGIHHGRGPGITTGMDVASATSVSVVSAMSMASSCGHKHSPATSAMDVERHRCSHHHHHYTWHHCLLPGWPPALAAGPRGDTSAPNTQIKPFNCSQRGQFQPTSIPNAEPSRGCRDADGPLAEGFPCCSCAPAQAGGSGRGTLGLSRGGTLCAPTLVPRTAPARERLWWGGGRAGGGSAGGGGAQRAPVLLSDMILLMAIGNGFAALAGRIRSFLPAFLPPPHGWARRRDAGRRLASLFAGSASSTAPASAAPDGGRDPTPVRIASGPGRGQPLSRRRARRGRCVPRGHGSCPKQVTLISPISDGETETGSSAVTLRGTQGPAPANSPLPKGGRRLLLLGQSRLHRARAGAKILPECSAQPKSMRLHKRHHTCREQRGTHAPTTHPLPAAVPLTLRVLHPVRHRQVREWPGERPGGEGDAAGLPELCWVLQVWDSAPRFWDHKGGGGEALPERDLLFS